MRLAVGGCREVLQHLNVARRFEEYGAGLSKFQRAALYVHNALHGRAPIVSSNKSLAARTLYHNKFYRAAHVTLCLAFL
jgi:hypothetical protein